jgi:DNA-binding transcriptional ArsR family regulator
MNKDDGNFQMPEIDRVVHEPARLAILTVLSSCEEADFLFLERATKLSRGNLSVQLTRLEDAGVIEIDKRIEHKRTLTTAKLSDRGRHTLNAYWESMNALRTAAEGRLTATAGSPKRTLPPRRRVPVGGLLATLVLPALWVHNPMAIEAAYGSWRRGCEGVRQTSATLNAPHLRT